MGDLVGDLAPLNQLVASDDPHGISDSFLYGISLNSIGREVAGEKNLVIMLSGTEPVVDEEIISNRRWERLATGFGEVGALLLLVVQPDAPGLHVLLNHLNGVILVRDQELAAAPDALVLARVASPARLTLRPGNPAAPAAQPARRVKKWQYLLIAALGAALLIALGLFALRHWSSGSKASASRRMTDARESVAVAAETLYVAPPANPEDASVAAAFAVELVAANTAEAANLELRRRGASLPSATVTPVPIGAERATWYKLMVGAYRERRQADSLLSALRASKMLDDSSGSVVRAPLALLVDSLPSQIGITAELKKSIDSYSTRGLPVYALMQDDGRARLYSGAFERAEQAGELLKTFRAAGLKPVLAYRTGHAPP